MRTVKAIVLGTFIWILGVSVYSFSYFISVLDDPELQANIFLAVAIIPIALIGSHFFYKKVSAMSGLKLSALVVLSAIFWDSVITVPFLIIPQGGSYKSFFLAPGFWLIALEYATLIWCFWKVKVGAKRIKVKG